MGEAKQDLGRELDAPLRRRLGGISGVVRDWGGGRQVTMGGQTRNGGSRVLARRPQPQPVVDGDTAAARCCCYCCFPRLLELQGSMGASVYDGVGTRRAAQLQGR